MKLKELKNILAFVIANELKNNNDFNNNHLWLLKINQNLVLKRLLIDYKNNVILRDDITLFCKCYIKLCIYDISFITFMYLYTNDTEIDYSIFFKLVKKECYFNILIFSFGLGYENDRLSKGLYLRG